MAYEKQTWQTGDTVTADKLNHMEDGIADAFNYPEPPEPTPSGVQFITESTMGDFTYNMVRGFVNDGILPVFSWTEGDVLLCLTYRAAYKEADDYYRIVFGTAGDEIGLSASGADEPLVYDD